MSSGRSAPIAAHGDANPPKLRNNPSLPGWAFCCIVFFEVSLTTALCFSGAHLAAPPRAPRPPRGLDLPLGRPYTLAFLVAHVARGSEAATNNVSETPHSGMLPRSRLKATEIVGGVVRLAFYVLRRGGTSYCSTAQYCTGRIANGHS